MDDENMAINKWLWLWRRQRETTIQNKMTLHMIFLRHSGSQLKRSQNIQLADMYIHMWRFAYARYRYAAVGPTWLIICIDN